MGERSRSDREVLEELCYEYPPKLRKIEKILEQIEDFHDFYNEINEDYVIFHEDFLGTFISEYFVRINEDWFGKYIYNEKTKQYDFYLPETLPKLKREKYATKIIKLFLKHGYDLGAHAGLVGASCLRALVVSLFNDELCNVALLLLSYGADPTIGCEEGYDTIADIEDSYLGLMDIRGCLEDDYLYNLPALYKYAEICRPVYDRIQSRPFPIKEPWAQKMLPKLPHGYEELCNCPNCDEDGEEIRLYKDQEIAQLICPTCGFTIKNAVYARNLMDCLAWRWNNTELGKNK